MKFGFEKRDRMPGYMRILNPVIFVILALAFCGILILTLGFNPLSVYTKMLKSAFGTGRGLSQSILYSIPLMLCGLAVSVAFKMNLNNIGAEGQYAIGAFAATAIVQFLPPMPVCIQLPVMFLVAIIAGAIWGGIAVLPKAFWDVNETIVTLMLNYVALLVLDYVCYGPWRNTTLTVPYTDTFPESAWLPNIPGTNIGIGFLSAIVVAIVIYLFFRFTTSGYQISVIRNSISAAKYAGINIKKNIIIVMLISGALAGMAGFVQVCGLTHKLQPNLPNNAGFTAIVIAYLSKFNPLVVILVSIFFGGLTTGSYAVQISGVPSQVATLIQGAILLFVLAGEIFTRYKFSFSHKEKMVSANKGGEA